MYICDPSMVTFAGIYHCSFVAGADARRCSSLRIFIGAWVGPTAILSFTLKFANVIRSAGKELGCV